MNNNVQPSVSYRKGNIDDLEQIKDLTWLAYSQFENVISKDNLKQWEAGLKKNDTYITLLNKAFCIVCEDENKIIGTAFLVPNGNPTELFQTDWAYLRLVGVSPEYEGKGIGRKLTEMCIDKARETGERTLALHTSEFQHAARHIYESLGFKKLKEFEIFGKKYWIYTLDLTK